MTLTPLPLDWLLDEADPSLRFRTLSELSETQDPAAIRAARRSIPGSAAVERLFARMHPDGYWLQKASDGRVVGDGVEYGSMASTHFCLAYLAELGLDRNDPRIARAAERYLSLQSADGDFWRHMSCLYAYNVRTFTMLGYGEDARLQKTIDLMLRTERPDGGYLCDVHEGKRKTRPVKSCMRGSTKALFAYASVPALWSTPRCRALVDYFLAREGIFRSDDLTRPVVREASQTAFPFTWGGGLLDVLVALSTLGFGRHTSLDRAWALLGSKRDAQGRYRLDWSPAQAPFKVGKRGDPSKWVTFYALLALRRRGIAQDRTPPSASL